MSNADNQSLKNTNATSGAPESTTTKAALAHPRFGLASSNSHSKEDVLLRIALQQGRFYAILESAAVDGLPFVREQLKRLQESGDIDAEHVVKLERMIRSIERGFAQAIEEGAALK